jgi:MFS family permease
VNVNTRLNVYTRRGKAPFRGLLTATLASTAGTSMSAIAIPWLVLSRTGSAAMTGTVAFAQMIAYVLAQLLAGPVADRVGLRRTFVAGNLVAALLVGAIPAADASVGGLPTGWLIILVAAAGAVRGAADTAGAALVPTAAELGGMAMERAAGLASGAQRTALLIGAPLGGALVATAGPGSAIAVDAATFALAAVTVALTLPEDARRAAVAVAVPHAAADTDTDTDPITATDTARATATARADAAEDGDAPAPAHGLRRYLHDLAEGFAFVRSDRLLLGIISMVLATNLLDQGFSEVMIPVWVKRELGTPAALGVIGAVSALGMVTGNLAGAWLGPRISRLNLYRVGFLVGGGPRMAALAFATTLAPVLGIFFITEIFGGSLNSVLGATTYERVPPALRARALGTIRATAWIGVPFGALLAGLLVQLLGLRTAVIAFAAAYFITTLSPFVLPIWHELKRSDPPPTAEAPAG